MYSSNTNINLSLNIENEVYAFINEYKAKYLNLDKLFEYAYSLIMQGEHDELDHRIFKDNINMIKASDNYSSSVKYNIMLLFTRDAFKTNCKIDVQINIFAINLYDQSLKENFSLSSRKK